MTDQSVQERFKAVLENASTDWGDWRTNPSLVVGILSDAVREDDRLRKALVLDALSRIGGESA